jgi:hypothetical protein
MLTARCVLLGALALAAGGGLQPGRGAEARPPASELRESRPGVRREVVRVVDAQLAAFRAGDVAAAYAFAAADFRANRPLLAFAQIVKSSYPEIWSSTKADFGPVRDDGTRATIQVRVYSESADAVYDYTLVREPGGWRIIGVLRTKA